MRHLTKAGSLLDLGQQRLELFFMRLAKGLNLALLHALNHSLGIQRHLLEVPHVVQHDL
jgi:hypothetical protein